MSRSRRRPSASMVVSCIALAVALSGTAIAASLITSKDLAANSVTAKKIKKNAVTAKKIKKNAVTNPKVKNLAITAEKLADGSVTNSKLADGSVTGPKLAANAVDATKIVNETITGAQVANNSLSYTKLSDFELIGNSYILVTATEGADAVAARAAAPETALFQKGQLEIYAKCFRDVGTDTTFAKTYARTTADGSVMEGNDNLPGGNAATDFLNVATLETSREISEEIVTGNDADYDEDEWALASPDGTTLNGQAGVGAKNGTLAGGNGLYGAGNVCLFQGSILG